MLLSTLLFIFILATTSPVAAAPGDPDPTFGVGGVVALPTA
jgi:hypothetical protein